MTSGRGNNFDALRIIGAFVVVLGHSFSLVGEVPHEIPGFVDSWASRN